MTNYFTWGEFDKSVDYIANQCKKLKLSGIYGVPRGGLCLAVALSHKLNVQLIEKPLKSSLIVDDVYETGMTLSNFKNIEVEFNIYSEKSISKLNEDKIKINNEIYTYIFRDYYVAMEYFLENFKDTKILSPENLKNEFTDNINKLRIKVSK